jgi:hypothetical protein
MTASTSPIQSIARTWCWLRRPPSARKQFVLGCLQRRYFAAGAKGPPLLGRVARLHAQTAGVLRDEISVAGVEVEAEAHDERFMIVDSRQAEGVVGVRYTWCGRSPTKRLPTS